jgi:hypothetical protein
MTLFSSACSALLQSSKSLRVEFAGDVGCRLLPRPPPYRGSVLRHDRTSQLGGADGENHSHGAHALRRFAESWRSTANVAHPPSPVSVVGTPSECGRRRWVFCESAGLMGKNASARQKLGHPSFLRNSNLSRCSPAAATSSVSRLCLLPTHLLPHTHTLAPDGLR